LIEVNLYDGRVEDWIETCVNLFSQDLKRLISYSLKSFKMNHKNVEFSRSVDYAFFRFVVLLLLKLVFKLDDQTLRNISVPGLNVNRTSILIDNLINFLIIRNKKEDLIVKKSGSLVKFFLRFFCLTFYQIPLYKHITVSLKNNLFSLVGLRPSIMIFGCENKNVTSAFISRFLARKLAQKYKWAELMSSMKRELNYMTDTEKFLYGYKIQFRGRFTRRSRSESVSVGYGRVSTSTITAVIDYATSSLTLRNGSGSVKVWLYRAPKFKTFSYKIL